MRTLRAHRAFIAALVYALSACGSDAFALNPALQVRQYVHTAWRVRDGFVKAILRSIAQTTDGYLWVGTDAGLVRFDGVRAVPWQPPPGQQLPSDKILSLLGSKDGTLWIGTDGGLASWKESRLLHYNALSGRKIIRLLEDHQASIWASTYTVATGKSSLCEIVRQRVQCYGDDGGPGEGAIGLYEDRRNNLWVR